jgi:hypothetical protein
MHIDLLAFAIIGAAIAWLIGALNGVRVVDQGNDEASTI